MARIAGVKSIHIAKIESYGENGKPVYGEVKELKQFISFSSTKVSIPSFLGSHSQSIIIVV